MQHLEEDEDDNMRSRREQGRVEEGSDRNAMVDLQGQVTEMNKLLQSMSLSQVNVAKSSFQIVQQVAKLGCVGWRESHDVGACPMNTETITYVKNDPCFNTYNARWRDHPNFSWGGQEQNV